jgi:hypothetical protein
MTTLWREPLKSKLPRNFVNNQPYSRLRGDDDFLTKIVYAKIMPVEKGDDIAFR